MRLEAESELLTLVRELSLVAIPTVSPARGSRVA